MKAHWQTYVMCLFCLHLDYFAAILEAKKILPTLYHGPRAGPGQKICCSLAERAGPGSFMLAPGGPGCKSAGPCHLYRKFSQDCFFDFFTVRDTDFRTSAYRRCNKDSALFLKHAFLCLKSIVMVFFEP